MSDTDIATESPELFDAILIGTGQAAPSLANRLTSAGMTVAVVERALVGGTCVNVGCTPTKAMVASAYAARMAARGAEYGVMLPGPARIDMAKISARVAGITGASRSGLERWMGGMRGCTLIRGHARLESPRTVRVGNRLLRADKIFLNVGGRALAPDSIKGLADVPYLTNTNMVAMDEVPEHLVVIGGSYVGLEFAQVFRRLGARVTVVERGSHLISREDAEVSLQVREILEKEDIVIRCGAECIQLHRHAEGVAVGVDCASGDPQIVGSHVLMAVGRRPNTDDLGLDKAGVSMDAHGYINVDDQLRTSVDGIWALGDCNGRGAFTHTAYNDFEVVAANVLDGANRSVAHRIPVYALYTDPPLGRVGMTEAQARKAGHRVRVGMRPMTRVARAVEKGESQGSMRVVVDADTDKILGAAILGPGGDEAVHMILTAMAAGMTATQVTQTMAIHPTVSELIPTIFGELADAK
ncbi:Pyruvate/2-oxoglutarate dehydrogenase complex, dihydrolipoamide dehydrogenase (E3) component [Cupriavidus sp. YR651]|uniref:FAD-containing oxidoreductase n=1 Tax=Cupriavidus sp. YR651 TaxID=1855315 RepID=UPI000888872E|nr:FAD-containing oxidoreductase [Cupriavidus sp. YR651]SDD71631.1 Pyruvate/2-oxoglutarate dehydrogenase complex, dihydrolipoamide dehydrogenase (E3) component [Cupriavidus sp. YR651]